MHAYYSLWLGFHDCRTEVLSAELAGASIEALELQMGEIKKGNEKRKLGV